MRPARIFRLIFRIFILFLTISVTLVAFLGGLSAFMILANPQNIGVDPSKAEFNIEMNNVTYEIDNINFTLPFNFTNAGYFDLENLELKVDLAINYSHIDYPSPGINQTRKVPILSKSQTFGTVEMGTTGYFNLTGLFSEFYIGNFPNFTTEVNWVRGPPAILFYANLTVNLDYTLGLHSLRIGILNLLVGELP
ncbi:MAG: hypothetical protein ACFFDY_10045 [Candidatus Thorarchaeota archaeon]